MKMVSRMLGAALLAALPAPVQAHIVLAEPAAETGSYYAGHFRVGHGCDGSPTVKLRIAIPGGVTIAGAQPKPGWTIAVEHTALPAPVTVEGKTATERVSAIVWTGRLEADQFDDFGVLMKLPETAGPLYFPAEQTCETGAKSWSQIPVSGQEWHDVAMPAPVLMVSAGAGAVAADVQSGNLTISGIKVPESPGGNGVAFLTVRNGGGEADRLIAVKADFAKAEIHEATMEGGTMSMRRVDGIDIPAGGEAVLGTGGYHIMLIGLIRPLHAGDAVSLTLVFEKAGEVAVTATVSARSSDGGAAHHDHH